MKSFIFALVVLGALGCANDPLKGLEPGVGPAVSDVALYALAQPGVTWAFYKSRSS